MVGDVRISRTPTAEGTLVLDAELRRLVRRAERDRGPHAALSPRALSGLLDDLAARPRLWESCVRHEPSCRWYGSLFRDDVVDLWLLTWQQDNSTDLHDHGGASGAFRVVAGELSEDRPVLEADGRTGLRRVRRTPGSTVAFGPRLVHDVHDVTPQPAVSLHVYSPPLAAMTYYEVVEGRLAPRHTEPVEVRPADTGLPERAAAVHA
jgi:hypothetical protein